MSAASAKRLVFAVPGDLDTPTGGYGYDRRLIAELRAAGWSVDVLSLGDGFPWPDDTTRASAVAMLDAVAAGTPVIVDGLAFGALPELAATVCHRVPVVALVHHPLALEAGVSPAQAEALQRSERAALAGARAVIVTSPATARSVAADYGVAPDRIAVAVPGTDRPARFLPDKVDSSRHLAGDDRLGGDDRPANLISVGSLVPRKGYDVLIEALARLRAVDWRLVIVGPQDRDPMTAAAVTASIAARGLGDRVTLAGTVSADRLAALYAEADLFVSASLFEGYGMAFAEATSFGLPVVGTTGGAIPDTVPPGAGILVPPGDVAALASALRDVIATPGTRARLAAAARAAAETLPRWTDTARIVAATLDAVMRDEPTTEPRKTAGAGTDP
ncbi:glycosyltransferase family 4 protein [Rhodoplanes azumiensis]|uniref:Glycosyltransferase family 4 protein n=1 Tax=Rhodoplanes azumiensis TaxID=1897628 RepID=A0ABW5APX5_9BRAD